MDNHIDQSMGRLLLIPKLGLLRAMGTDTMKQNMKTRLPVIIPMENMEVHSQGPIKLLIQAMLHRTSMVSHPMACHRMDLLHNPMVSLDLVNQVIYHIKVLSHQRNHMVKMRSHKHTHAGQVGPCSKVILHMVLHLLLMGIINHCLLLDLPQFIPSKVDSLFQQVMVSSL